MFRIADHPGITNAKLVFRYFWTGKSASSS